MAIRSIHLLLAASLISLFFSCKSRNDASFKNSSGTRIETLTDFRLNFSLGNVPQIALVQSDVKPVIVAKALDSERLDVMTPTLEKIRNYFYSGNPIQVCVRGESIVADSNCEESTPQSTSLTDGKSRTPSTDPVNNLQVFLAQSVSFKIESGNRSQVTISASKSPTALGGDSGNYTTTFSDSAGNQFVADVLSALMSAYPNRANVKLCIDPSNSSKELASTLECARLN